LQKFSNSQMADIAFNANWPSYEDALNRINPERYRGLGEVRTKLFARLAFADARALGLNTVGGVCWYLIPCSWLGLNFLRDPRYVQIGHMLAGQDDDGTEDARLENARARFCWIAEHTTGLNGEFVPAAVDRSLSAFPFLQDPQMTPYRIVEALLDAFALTPQFREAFPRGMFIDTCADEAYRAGLHGPDAVKVHVAIAFWLGSGFLRDPQFAWTQDVIADARNHRADPISALAAYAAKRLDRMAVRSRGVA
jgi:hypothetical protein